MIWIHTLEGAAGVEGGAAAGSGFSIDDMETAAGVDEFRVDGSCAERLREGDDVRLSALLVGLAGSALYPLVFLGCECEWGLRFLAARLASTGEDGEPYPLR